MTQRNRGIRHKAGKARAALTLTHPNAADIDIGGAAHDVAVPQDGTITTQRPNEM